MARTPLRTINEENQADAGEIAEIQTMADAWETLNQLQAEASDNAIAVARQVGYDGTLTVGALEDEIRFYQRRSVEACIELGKRLLVLKELAAHGEFQQRIELLGIAPRMAQKFMSATLKFSNANSNTLLKAAGTQTKMLELLVLDDGEIEALESGDTVRGVTLDKIETMSVSELKKALRDAKERLESKDSVIKDKSAKIDQQAEQLAMLDAKKRNESPISADQALIDARTNLQITAVNLKMDAASRLMRQTRELLALDKSQAQYAAALIIEIKTELDIIVGDCGLPETVSTDLTPEWMKPGWEDKLPEQYSGLPSVSEVLIEQ